MDVCFANKEFAIPSSLCERHVNREASSYVIDNYNNLIKYIKMDLDIKEEKAQDLLHDVYISLAEAEEEGRGYNLNFTTENSEHHKVKKFKNKDKDNTFISVEQFVIGRIRGYALNSKYRTDIVDKGKSVVLRTEYEVDTTIDNAGKLDINKDGTIKEKKIKKIKKESINIISSAASFNDVDSDSETNDKFQLAYMTASVADSTNEVVEMESIREELNYCIDFCSLHNFSIINVLKNIDILVSKMDFSKKRKNYLEPAFASLTDLVMNHDEFADALTSVFKFSASNKGAFEAIIAEY